MAIQNHDLKSLQSLSYFMVMSSLLVLKVFSFARYDPSLSFSTENWYEIWPAKQMDPLKKKQLVLQVHDSCWLMAYKL